MAKFKDSSATDATTVSHEGGTDVADRSIGSIIAETRNLTADQLAEMTGYGRRSVYWMLLGQSPPNATRTKPAKVAPIKMG